MDPSPHPLDYTGTYTSPQGVTLAVTLLGGPGRQDSAMLFDATAPGFRVQFYLQWLGIEAGGDAFGAWAPSDVYGCLAGELEAV